MVKIILVLAGVAFVMGAILTTFDGTLPKVDSMRGNMAKGVSRLEKANQEYLADIAKVKLEAHEQFMLNAQRLAGVRTDMGVKKYDQEYMKKLTSLDKRNTEMKSKIQNYRPDGVDNWTVFKGNFNRDMEKIAKECRQFAKAVKKI